MVAGTVMTLSPGESISIPITDRILFSISYAIQFTGLDPVPGEKILLTAQNGMGLPLMSSVLDVGGETFGEPSALLVVHDPTGGPDVIVNETCAAGSGAPAIQPLDLGNLTGDFQVGEQAPGFMRGDVNLDGGFNIGDVVGILSTLFVGGVDPLLCEDAADINDDETLNIADAVTGLNFLFGGTPPPLEFLVCGPDSTPGGLNCALYPSCP